MLPIDHIYIINLDHRTDRWDTIQKLVHNLFSTEGDSRWSRFSGIIPDLQVVSETCYNRFTINPEVKKDKERVRNYLTGATGCKMSHVEIIRDAKSKGYKQILILEDDACLPPNLSVAQFRKDLYEALLELQVRNWWMCYLGGKNVGEVYPFGRKIARINGIKTTHAYLIHERCFDLVLHGMMNSGLEADVFYQWIHTQCRCFRITPGILIQSEDYSDILGQNVNYKKIV